MSELGARPRITRYPPDDPVFAASVDSSVGAVAGRPIKDEGVLAAVQALIRTTYPLATVRVRFKAPIDSADWDAFRDESALDDEMVLRARMGDGQAVENMFDRHYALAYGLAVRVAADSDVAAAAVVSAFRSMVADRQPAWPARIRLAMASCNAAIEALPDRLPSRTDIARAVVELAHVHFLSVSEIAAVLRLDPQHVATLAIEGLRDSSKSSA